MSNLSCPMCDHGADAQEAGVVTCRNCWHVFRIKDDGTVEPVPPGDSPEGWQLECERLAFNAAALLRLACRHITTSAVQEVIRSAPRSKAEVEAKRGMTDISLMYRLVRDAHRFSPGDKDLFVSILEYFTSYLLNMDKDQRARLEACVMGSLLGYGMG